MDRTTLDAVKDALLKQPEILAKEFERQSNKQREFLDTALNRSTLTDKKLIRILKEQANAEGTYKEKIDKLLQDYIKEKNLQGEQLEELNRLTEKSAKIQELQKYSELENRKREQKENPLTAFKHAFEDLKNSNKEKGYFDVKSSAKTLGKGLLEGINLKTISKGLLHGVGVMFDNPAFNILADKISTSVKYQEIQNERQFEFLKELENIQDDKNSEPKAEKTKAEKDFEDDAEKTKEVITEIRTETASGLNETNIKPVIEKLNSIEGNTESTYIDLGSTLENIKSELEKHTAIYKEQLFIAKDSDNDVKPESNLLDYNKTAVATKTEEDEKEGDFGLLGNMASDLFNGDSKKNKKGKGFKGKATNALKGLGSLAMNIGRIAGPIALVTGAVVSVYEGIKGYQNAVETFDLDEGQIATTSQKLTSSISGIIDALTFGLLDEKAIAQKIDDMNSYVTTGIKKIFGQYDNAEKITDELEAKGVIDKSVIGNSEVRDWSAIEKLSLPQLQSLYDFGDWDKETESKLKDLIRQSSNGKEVLDSNMSVNRVDPYSSSTYKTPVAQTDTQIKMANLNKEAISSNVNSMSKEDKENWFKERGYDTNTGKFTESVNNTSIKSVDKNTESVNNTSIKSVDKNTESVNNTSIKSIDKNTESVNNTSIKSTPNVFNEKLPEPEPNVQVSQPNVVVQAPPATVVNNEKNDRKIDNLNLTDKDSMILISTLGVGR